MEDHINELERYTERSIRRLTDEVKALRDLIDDIEYKVELLSDRVSRMEKRLTR